MKCLSSLACSDSSQRRRDSQSGKRIYWERQYRRSCKPGVTSRDAALSESLSLLHDINIVLVCLLLLLNFERQTLLSIVGQLGFFYRASLWTSAWSWQVIKIAVWCVKTVLTHFNIIIVCSDRESWYDLYVGKCQLCQEGEKPTVASTACNIVFRVETVLHLTFAPVPHRYRRRRRRKR